MTDRAPRKRKIMFYTVWRERPCESLMVEAGLLTLTDHLELCPATASVCAVPAESVRWGKFSGPSS